MIKYPENGKTYCLHLTICIKLLLSKVKIKMVEKITLPFCSATLNKNSKTVWQAVELAQGKIERVRRGRAAAAAAAAPAAAEVPPSFPDPLLASSHHFHSSSNKTKSPAISSPVLVSYICFPLLAVPVALVGQKAPQSNVHIPEKTLLP